MWFVRQGTPDDQVAAEVEAGHFIIADFDQSRAIASAILEPKTRQRGLSLADRACLALAIELGLPAVTADRAWRDLDVGVQIRLIR